MRPSLRPPVPRFPRGDTRRDRIPRGEGPGQGAGGGRWRQPAVRHPARHPKGAEPELRWALIRKVYIVLCLQLLLTAVVAVVVVKVRTIPHFFVSSYAGLGLYVFLLILPFTVMCSVSIYLQKRRVNLLLLGVFTVAISFFVGLTCAFNRVDMVLVEAAGADLERLKSMAFGSVSVEAGGAVRPDEPSQGDAEAGSPHAHG
ncbi:hypothetical protein ZWY2020_002721 [Hordeum vulgare]|nr:hypothetical protein ZWY2020_002721 [Hordeum vulgare]